MNKTLTSFVAFLMLATSAATLVQADQQNYEPTDEEMQAFDAEREERIEEFLADFHAPSVLDTTEAADLLVALATGEELAPDAKLQLAKFMRDAEGAGLDAPMTEEFADAATRGYLAENGLDIARDLIADDDGFDALVERGAFEGLTLEETMLLVAPLGVDEDGVQRNQDLIAAYRDLPEEVPSFKMGPWGQDHWDTIGVTATLVQLAVAAVSPVGASNFLPHNIGVNALYIAAKLTSGSSGDFWRGYVWAQVDVDDLLGVKFDLRQNTDTIALQLPLSVRTELHWQVTCGWLGCYIVFWIVIQFPQTIMANNPVWEFAVPAQSGGFASRAESGDILTIVYDRLGTIHTQKAREATSAPPTLPVGVPGGHPGAGDIGTQAPVVNFYGLQGDFSSVPSTPSLPAPPVTVPDVRERQRGAFATPGDSTGLTAGFTADRTQAWHLNAMFVRLSTAGLGSTGAVPEPPATIYYDSSSNIFTGSGLMYFNDWNAANPVNV